ncbi:hypothetical protein BVX94_02630 [bacterium B17]|nr:hypothetical protein BVX94_02630 [bacterium B17]
MSNKFKFLSLVVLSSLMFMVSGCEDDGSSHDYGDNDANYYVAMGDSITEGYGDAGTPYPERLAGMIGKTVANEGKSGETSDEGAARINSLLSSYKPGHLLVLYGANDVLRSRDNADIISYLRTIIQAAKSNQTVPELATLTPITGHDGAYASAVQSLNTDIRSLASEEGVRLVDLESAFNGTGNVDAYLQSDGLHPNSDGSQLIAESFL